MSSSPTNIEFPFRRDASHRVATTTYDRHVRQMIEQVLFTNPGERVNRPTFGCGLRRYVFEPTSTELLSAAEANVSNELHKWLSDVIHVSSVDISIQDSTLFVNVSYIELDTSVSRTAEYSAATHR